jgi:hypothetical protein
MRVTDELGVASGERTWRAPLPYRVLLIAVQTSLVAAAAAFGWVTLWSNQLPGQVVLAVAVPLWALFAFRAWTVSAKLTQDSLVIRNVLSTEQVLVADITRVTLSTRGQPLKVIERRPPSSIVTPGAAFPRHADPGQPYTVTAVQVGVLASLSGMHCEADDAADLIAAAAGLPSLPARKARVSREMSLVMIPAGLVFFALGVALSAAGHPSADSVGGGLKAVGAMLFVVALLAEFGRFIARRARP